jgi:hypothetical protein
MSSYSTVLTATAWAHARGGEATREARSPVRVAAVVVALGVLAATSACASGAETAGGERASSMGAAPGELSDAVVKAVYGACPGVEVQQTGTGWMALQWEGTQIVVAGTQSCELKRDMRTGRESGEVNVMITASDARTKAETAVIHRQRIVEGASSCAALLADMQLRQEFLATNRQACTESFTPPPPVPLDLLALVGAKLQQHGAVSLLDTYPSTQGFVWTRNGRRIELTGEFLCDRGSTTIETPWSRGTPMRSFLVRASLKAVEPSRQVQVGQWKEATTALGLDCDRAVRANKVEDFTDRLVAGIVRDADRSAPSDAAP